MTDTKQARERAWAALEKCITSVPGKYQIKTIGFPANRVPIEDAFADIQFEGEAEKAMTFGNVMVEVLLTVRLFFRHPQTVEDERRHEMNVWHVCRDVQAAIRANSTLDGNVTDLGIGLAAMSDMAVGLEGGAVEVRCMTIPVQFQELEAEEIRA